VAVAETILRAAGISKEFGGLVALNNVDFSVRRGSITAVIGPNGAGKSTLINVMTGVCPPTSGVIDLNGATISGLKSHEIACLGIARTFQTAQIFSAMSVLENVMVGRHTKTGCGMMASALGLGRMRREEKSIRDKALYYLDMVGLGALAGQPAASVPIGTQRLLEIGRALAAEPVVLLLDEPAAGLNTQETRALGKLIGTIREMGITVIIVEHDMELVMDIADEILVLNFGSRLAWGTPEQIQANPEVIDVYLGKED
jgi:branched-chain amino acid transport system ATP-binding protein